MSKDNGGPAFPAYVQTDAEFNGHNQGKETITLTGMTLRDYFAAKAMQGFAAHMLGAEKRSGETGAQANARLAYQYADAMLEARK